MKLSLESLARIAEVEFSEIISDSAHLGEKLRLFLPDTSYIDIWLSTIIQDRFGFHWERRHLDGSVYRYANFPDTVWRTVDTYHRHLTMVHKV
ncbi:MAG: hypothetical protein ACOYYU_00235 [Chloroflexota bacterium]